MLVLREALLRLCLGFVMLFAFLFPPGASHLFQPLCHLFEHSAGVVRFLLS